ncbi:MAG: hypothetical protein C0626_10705 [Arcobacter sp.]|uniref:pentapeptide repeat-containing protein n=1 Tax=uncultured Arcobacter sp. TaxID=165434 RepID=UPI000CBF57F7|nr:pentapeptide repeat-containing protein [uncultured Arcobacter sp.]PLY09442.1 MAG: hypothetical protein C0626_10705 [Arcobacter sp.]
MNKIRNYQNINLADKSAINQYTSLASTCHEFKNKKFITNDTKNGNSFFSNIINPHPNNKTVRFEECIFPRDFYLPTIHFLDKSREILPIDMLMFKNCIFEKEVNLDDKEIHCEIIFNNCIFLDTVNLRNTFFSSYCDFSRSVFCKGINLELTSFDEITNFKDIMITHDYKFDLRNCYINNKTYFLGIKSFTKEININNNLTVKENYNNLNNKFEEYINVKNRETARIIKDSFEQQNNIIEANKFYALEMEEREKELSFLKNPFEWLVFKFHKISSDHSQDWLLALFWIINITFLFGLIDIEKMSYVQILDKTLILLIAGIGISYISMKLRGLISIPFTYIYYKLYIFSTNDSNLDCFAKNLNPFSIMRGDEPITFGTLIFKIIIAYLIYQLIISIRQNTRRK